MTAVDTAGEALARTFFAELGMAVGIALVIALVVVASLVVLVAGVAGWQLNLSRRDALLLVAAGVGIAVFGNGIVVIAGVGLGVFGAASLFL